jgi:hypothetical protein
MSFVIPERTCSEDPEAVFVTIDIDGRLKAVA